MSTARFLRLAVLCVVLAAAPFGAEAQTRRGAVKPDYDPSLGVRVPSPLGARQLPAPTGALTAPRTFSDQELEPH